MERETNERKNRKAVDRKRFIVTLFFLELVLRIKINIGVDSKADRKEDGVADRAGNLSNLSFNCSENSRQS